uniref:Ubiquitin-fold modifier 1 n=1 Tax=Naja naja TaxID=35670 RepID=A0A8C7DWQ7_NAJNA
NVKLTFKVLLISDPLLPYTKLRIPPPVMLAQEFWEEFQVPATTSVIIINDGIEINTDWALVLSSKLGNLVANVSSLFEKTFSVCFELCVPVRALVFKYLFMGCKFVWMLFVQLLLSQGLTSDCLIVWLLLLRHGYFGFKYCLHDVNWCCLCGYC